ncbi:MAG TPA: hypothetical protein VN428_21705 [Bryobacteraceae bacterium]|nr:hypothetical protein [Bryobacteraceae bacterium]
MPRYEVHYVFTPTAPFGLPDGAKLVLPAGERTISGPLVHVKAGAVASHGTLSEFRRDADALALTCGDDECMLVMHDNFGHIALQASSAQEAHERVQPIVDRLCRGLSIETGQRFSAELQFIEDASHNVSVLQPPKVLSLGTTSTFNIPQLRGQFERTVNWARDDDPSIDKALVYVEHAFLLNEFAASLGVLSEQAAFSRGLAFLQLFKALSVILGEKGQDSDYQRRFRVLGLPPTFWKDKVEPLYVIRNDEDVAHYRLHPLDPGAFTTAFGKALAVLREALAAYVVARK